jgi:hypothetical protein
MEPTILRLPEASARQLLLARAVDEADAEGALLDSVERDRLEQEALEATRDAAMAAAPDRAAYLNARAVRLLAAVEQRHPQLAGLRQPEPWRIWLAWLMPLGACLLGALFDRIENPQRVNMLSPPLLAVLLWNVLAYVALVAAWFLPQHWPVVSVPGALQRWLVRGRRRPAHPRRLRQDVLARFHRHWLQATGAQQAAWTRQVLHATAAGWAVGLGLSIVLGGLVRQYRVGWESTLLELHQVHTFLGLVFAPVVALLPLEGFSMEQLQRMEFGSGAAIGVAEARHWVALYLGLLAVVVVVPRALLAAWAAWRVRRLAAAVVIDARDPYFVQVLARVSPARVTVGVLAFDEAARDVLLQVMRQASGRAPPRRLEAPWTVLATAKADALRLFDIPPATRPPAPVAPALAGGPSPARAWLQDLMGRFRAAPSPQGDALQGALQDTDLVLLLPSRPDDLMDASRLLHWLDRPALVLVRDPSRAADGLAAWRAATRQAALVADVLALADCTGNWSRDALLLDAIASRLPQGKRSGFARVADAWNERNVQRLDEAMQGIAQLLLAAARDSAAAGGGVLSLKRLVSVGQREAEQQARQVAQDAMVERLHVAEAAHLAALLRLHGVDAAMATATAPLPGDRFTVQAPLGSPQAGMAGAATGAALGVGIDLATGGLTLGAAAALGAMIGGGAAFVGAAWRQRGGGAQQGQVQLNDEMLQALCEAALLRYLAVVHASRGRDGAAAPAPAWRSEVVMAVESAREPLAEIWRQARAPAAPANLQAMLAARLNAIARQVLARL